MRSDELETVLDVAIAAALAGGVVLQRFWNEGVASRSKVGGKSYDLVSDADIQSQAAIVDRLSETFPSHAILGEEDLTADLNADHLWIVDPLDGTNNFTHHVPHYAVSIGYFRAGIPTVGVVHQPTTGDTYTAIRGRFAKRGVSSIRSSDCERLSESLIGCGFYYDRGDMMRRTLAAIEDFFAEDIHGIRRFGTASLDLCAVACGQLGAFFEYKLSPWDFAAGQLLVTEAGGMVTDANGKSLGIEPSSVLAAGPRLHESALRITAAHHP